MRLLIVGQLGYYRTPVTGLALARRMLQAMSSVLARIDAALPIKGGVSNSDIVRNGLGLLRQSKSDFDAVEYFRGDVFSSSKH